MLTRRRPPRSRGAEPALAACLLLVGLAAAPAAGEPGPAVTVAVHHDVLLRLAAVKRPAEPARREEAERAEDTSLPSGSGEAPPLAHGGIIAGVTAPPPRLVLESLADTANPSDSTGDAGPHHYFQVGNGGFTIWDKQGHRLLISEYLPSLWDGFGGLCEQFAGDPYVLYDGLADRWLVAVVSAQRFDVGPWLECVALSQSGDPLGSWTRWAWSFDRLNDFPKFGVWPDAYYMTFNSPTHAVIALERGKMLAGDPSPRKIQFDLNRDTWGVHSLLVPADLEGARRPPAGAPNPVLAVKQGLLGADTIELLELHVDWVHPQGSSLRRAATFPLSPRADSRQGPFHRAVYRNFGAFEALATTTIVVDAVAGEFDLEWYQFRRRKGGRWTLWQQGDFNPDDGWETLATAAMDGAGNMGFAWQKTNEALGVPARERTPSVQYSGRQPADPPGLLRAPRTLVDSQVVEGSGRFGDYTSIVVDPADDCTFWLTGQYSVAGASRPQTNIRFGTFAFRNCPDTKAPETRIDSGPPEASAAVARFAFASSERGSMFDCSLDAVAFAPCASPLRLSGLAATRHTLRVRAIDSAGNLDATPATWTWSVRRSLLRH